MLCAIAARAAELPPDCMPLSEVQIGMIGQARSVVQGFKPDDYKVEIIGIEAGALPGSAMILARVEGKGLEKHGIVAGMSGSPVYINGKIIGAIAFGWSFSYNPIAGITPIESMLTMLDDLDRPSLREKNLKARAARAAGKGAGVAAAGAGIGWDWRPEFEAYMNGGEQAPSRAVALEPKSGELRELSGGRMMMEPLGAPVFVSSASPLAYARLDAFFGARGLSLMAAGSGSGSGGDSDEPAPPLEAGSSIGVPMMTGDVTVAGMGTVTYRQGNKILAFGHPMFSDGEADIPMAAGYIFGYMQSYSRSFKLGETREIVGTIRQDRQFAIGGVFGPAPERVPITVKVGGEGSSRPREYNFSAWEDRDFLPQLAGIAVMESYAGSAADGDDMTGDCRTTVRLADGRKFAKSLRASSRGGLSVPFFRSVLQDLFLMVGNPYDGADVAAVEVEIEARPGFRMDALQKAAPRYAAVKRGEKIEIDTTWRPFRGDAYSKRLSITAPKDLPKGVYALHVADAATAIRIDERRDPGRFRPLDFKQTLDLVDRLDYPENRLYVYLLEPEQGSSVAGDALEAMPASLRGVVEATAPQELQTPILGRVVAAETFDFEYPLSARGSFAVEIVDYQPR